MATYDLECLKTHLTAASVENIFRSQSSKDDKNIMISDIINNATDMCKISAPTSVEGFQNASVTQASPSPVPSSPAPAPASYNQPSQSELSTASLISSIVGNLIYLAIGVCAVYLSWTCNTAAGIDVVPKVIYAIFAFLFNLLYLIFYLIFRAGTCGTPVYFKKRR